jgi:hypothetical protein
MLRSDAWIFDDFTPKELHRVAEDYAVEWLLDHGFGCQKNSGTQIAITTNGFKFLHRMLGAVWSEPPSMILVKPKQVDELRRLISELRQSHPHEDKFVLAQMVAQLILVGVLGQEWFNVHVAADKAPSDFFRNGGTDDQRVTVGAMRVIHLAEMIFNMQRLSGLENSIKQVRNGQVESGFAELEVGKLLHVHGRTFHFVTPSGERGKDYDLEIDFDGVRACADTKCKIEATALSDKTLLGTLGVGRDQLPADRPGLLFVKVPQAWNHATDETALGNFLKQTTLKFFRGTGRVVSVKYHVSVILEDGAVASPMIYLAEFTNPQHRFDQTSGWDIFKGYERLPDWWVGLLAECDDK